MVVPNALQVIRMAPGRRFCVLGRLSSEVGWPHGELIERLEVCIILLDPYLVERDVPPSVVPAAQSQT